MSKALNVHFFEWHKLKCDFVEAELRHDDGTLYTDEECGMLAHRELIKRLNDDDKHDAQVDNWITNDWRYPKGEGAIVRNMMRGAEEMKIGLAFPGTFLAAKDGGWPRKFTIERFAEHEKVGDDIKPAIFFREEERGLVLNKTIANQLTVMYGDETDRWIGKPVVVYVDESVTYGGKPTPALRVRKPKQPQATKPAISFIDEDVDFDQDPPF